MSELSNLGVEGMTEAEFNDPRVLIVDASGGNPQTVEVDADMIAAEGLMLAERQMLKNGPSRPNRGHQKLMTKAQFKEQEMNEAMGYPSNLEEAEKTKSLEKKVAGLESGIAEILSRLSGGTNVVVPQLCYPPPVQSSPSQSFPATLQRKVVRPVRVTRPVSKPPVLTETLTTMNQATQEVHEESPIDSEPFTSRRTPLNLGTTDQENRLGLVDSDYHLENPDMWIEQPASEVEVDPKIERLARLLVEVTAYLTTHDCRVFFSNILTRTISRHLGFNSWNVNVRAWFLESFKTILADPVFLRGQILGVMCTEMGHALSVKKIAELCIAAGGFLAYSLAVAECNP